MRKPGRMEQLLEEEWDERGAGEKHGAWAFLLETVGEGSEKCFLWCEGSFRGSQDYNGLITRLELPNQ